MNLSSIFCVVCLETSDKPDDYVEFKTKMKSKTSEEELTYLDCFELVTNLKIDVNVIREPRLCRVCRFELENAFNFLRKAEKSQRLLYEKIELEQALKQTELNQDLDLNDLIEEIVSEECPTIPVLTDAMFGVSSTNYFDTFSESDHLHSENDIKRVYLSPLNSNESNFILTDSTDPTDDIPMIPTDGMNLATSDDDGESKYITSNDDDGESKYITSNDDDGESKHITSNEDEIYNCNLCPKKFDSSISLKTHLKYHKRQKGRVPSDACSICDRKFSTRSYLRQHMALVHAVKRQQFKCDDCEKIYFTKSALRNHKRFHTGETINCTDCAKSFVTQYDLKIHMRFHTRDYPYVCNLCKKKFPIKGHLTSHLNLEHQGLKFQCEACGKQFSSTKALSDHSFVHTGEMPYPCNYCKKSYPSKQKFKAHLMSAHKVEYDELEHTTKALLKSTPRRKNLTLVKADSVIKQFEDETKSEIDDDLNDLSLVQTDSIIKQMADDIKSEFDGGLNGSSLDELVLEVI